MDSELKLTDPYTAEGYDKIVWAKNLLDFSTLFYILKRFGFIISKKNKWEMLTNHFNWIECEMTSEQLRQALNIVFNKTETHKLGEEFKAVIQCCPK